MSIKTTKNLQSVRDSLTDASNLQATMSEDQLQAKCFQWAWNEFPATRRLLFHVPNGGSRNAVEALKLRSIGVVKGVHDLVFIWRGKIYFFELKVGSNKQSPEQVQFGQAVSAHGAICIEIRSFEQFACQMNQIINPATGINL